MQVNHAQWIDASSIAVAAGHQGAAVELTLELARHPWGGWQARRPNGVWGPRCFSAASATLLEVGSAIAEVLDTEAP